MINILYVIDNLEIGGAQELILTTLKAINRQKYHLIIASLFSGGGILDEILKQGIKVCELRMKSKYDLAVIFKMAGIMKKEKIKIVHTHLALSNFYGRLAAKLAGVPVIVTTYHNIIFSKKFYYFWSDRLMRPFTDKMITVSEAIEGWMIKHERVNPLKIFTIYNAIDLNKFSVAGNFSEKRKSLNLGEKEFLIGIVAALSEQNNVSCTIKAMAEMIKVFPEAKLLIVGDGPLRGELEDLSSKLKIKANTIFYGQRRDIPEILPIIDVFTISPSFEGFGIVLLEAMIYGKPVVATRTGGIPEIVEDQKTGFLVSPNKPEVLAEAILKLLKNKELARSMGEKGRKLVREKFNSGIMVGKLEKVYDLLIRGKIFSGCNCNLCNSNEAKLIYRGKTSNIIKCLRCGLLYNDPIFLNQDLKELYEQEDYYASYTKRKEYWINFYHRLLGGVEKYKSGGKLLDVGCGLGLFMNLAKSKGWQVYGVEPSIYASNYAKKEFNLDVFNSELKGVNLNIESFDLVSFLGVLGNIADPLTNLKKASQLLKKDGLLAAEVANRPEFVIKIAKVISLFAPKIESFLHLPYQLNHFNESTLRQLLIKANFQIIELQKTRDVQYHVNYNLGMIRILRQWIINVLSVVFNRGIILVFARKI